MPGKVHVRKSSAEQKRLPKQTSWVLRGALAAGLMAAHAGRDKETSLEDGQDVIISTDVKERKQDDAFRPASAAPSELERPVAHATGMRDHFLNSADTDTKRQIVDEEKMTDHIQIMADLAEEYHCKVTPLDDRAFSVSVGRMPFQMLVRIDENGYMVSDQMSGWSKIDDEEVLRQRIIALVEYSEAYDREHKDEEDAYLAEMRTRITQKKQTAVEPQEKKIEVSSDDESWLQNAPVETISVELTSDNDKEPEEGS